MSGWVFIIAGLLLVGMGGLSIHYGKELLRHGNSSASTAPMPAPPKIKSLSPQQERLLDLLHNYQVQFAARKLIILRGGHVRFDESIEGTPETTLNTDINIAEELFGTEGDPQARGRQFEALMESLPTEYLRMIPEFRLGSPYVVIVTDEGIAYLKK